MGGTEFVDGKHGFLCLITLVQVCGAWQEGGGGWIEGCKMVLPVG